MLHTPAPLEAVSDFFGAEIAGYSVLQLTVGVFAVAALVGGARWAVNKTLGKS